MKTIVKIFKVLIGLAIFGVGLFAVVMQLTSPMVESAEAFFRAVQQRDFNRARFLMAREAIRTTDDRALWALAQNDALSRFGSIEFSNRHITTGGRGELKGIITTGSGRTVPVKFVMVREGEVWKVLSFQSST